MGSGKKALWDKALAITSLALCSYVLMIAYFGPPEAFAYRSMFVSFLLVLCFLKYPLKKGAREAGFNLYTLLDIIFVLLPVVGQVYIFWEYTAFQMRFAYPNAIDKFLAVATIVLVLEATRRVLGPALVLIAAGSIVVVLYAEHLPGVFRSPSVPLEQLITTLYMGFDGVFGIPIQVMSTFIMLFIIFGGLLSATRAGEFFIKLAMAVAGRSPGGPAKVAVIAACLIGMISGSAVANVMITGTLTIPLMVKLGYKPVFAGAVSAVASTGGMLMPPVMGAAAFIIAQTMGLPYIAVCKAALLPALLYYYTCFLAVHLVAKRDNLQGLPASEVPEFWPLLRRGWHLFAPIIGIVYALMVGFTAGRASLYGIASLFLLSFIRRETRLDARQFVRALSKSVSDSVQIGLACACAGIITGCIYAAGLGTRFTSLMLTLSGGNLVIILAFSMVASIILGIGLPATATYITVSLLVIPVLTKMHVAEMAAHMFPFIYAIVAGITPPVAETAFAAAGIAKSDPNSTGWAAFFLSLPIYIIPFSFVFAPQLLLVGTAAQVLQSVVFGVAACTAVTIGTSGYFRDRMSPIERGLAVASGVAILLHQWWSPIALVCAGIVLARNWFIAVKKAKAIQA